MTIRYAIICSILIILGSIVGGRVAAQGENYDIPLVKGLLEHPEGLAWSGFEKQTNRLGDRVSIALLKILDERDFQSPQTVRKALELIRHSFLLPQLISIPSDRQPRVTLFLLAHFAKELTDPVLREEVTNVIKFVKAKTAVSG